MFAGWIIYASKKQKGTTTPNMYTDHATSVYRPRHKCIQTTPQVYTRGGAKIALNRLKDKDLQKREKIIQDYQDNQDNQHLRRLV